MSTRIEELELQVSSLQKRLLEAKQELQRLKASKSHASSLPLELGEYKRYGRQLIMPQVGLQGQINIKSSSVCVVGGGGLGCPAIAYLAGAGVGTIGVVDGDIVELSNLPRQILHKTEGVGTFKADSIAQFVASLNPDVKCIPYRHHLEPHNAIGIFTQYDLVLDCTDMPASRYLISDACVMARKPLVSASALRTDGQLMVLNNPPRPPGNVSGGPCYRCVWPHPPPPETVMSCGEGGILGPVVGVMGVLMSLEAIKILCSGVNTETVADSEPKTGPPASLLIFSANSPQQFRTVKLRGRRNECRTCSAQATITANSLLTGSLDYQQFCGVVIPSDVLKQTERITPTAFSEIQRQGDAKGDPVLIDVREKAHFDVFSLPGSINIPFQDMSSWPDSGDALEQHKELQEVIRSDQSVHLICRLGNDSQSAVRILKNLGLDRAGQRYVGDIEGGWMRWRSEVPGEWPEY